MKIAGKAILALTLVGSGGIAGFYFGRSYGFVESAPTVVIDGPSVALPGDSITFDASRSASAVPIEWWRDGRLESRGNIYRADGVSPGPLIVTAIGFGRGRNPEHAVFSKYVAVGARPDPTPIPNPPGPTPPPDPTPPSRLKVKWAIILYDPAASDPRIAAIRADGALRRYFQDKGINFRCLDVTDPEVQAKFAGYFRSGIPVPPSLILMDETNAGPPFVGPMPTTSAAIQDLVNRYKP